MHLKRIRVPNFRVLKDVDISFELDLVPQIFPLGSINGGGKSTLLQLIFTLLHCPGKYERLPYLQNMLDGFTLDDNSRYRDLANIDLIIDDQEIEIDFFVCDRYYIINDLSIVDGENKPVAIEAEVKIASLINLHNSLDNTQEFILKIKTRLKKIKNKIEEMDRDIEEYRNRKGEGEKYSSSSYRFDEIKLSDQEVDEIERFIPNVDKRIRELALRFNQLKMSRDGSNHIKIELLDDIFNNVERSEFDLLTNKQKSLKFQTISNRKDSLNSVTLFVCYCNESSQDRELFLMCNIKNLAFGNVLSKFKDRIFLAAPITQIFHFLKPADKLLLFRESQYGSTYHSKIKEAKSSLAGFFSYDFLAVDLLVQAFKNARDDDFKQAISTGEYGSQYRKVITDLAGILGNTKVNVDLDLGGVNFTKVDEIGMRIKLHPSDLSHGELKRLSLYVWLKYNKIDDAIVLMDEVEIALHPDWQYGIINDLQTWAPNNQYILATHSYELCQALTPAHVKEIEPKLLKQQK
jgi:predicted  nucleic acid-binding Zn-ribbon protein